MRMELFLVYFINCVVLFAQVVIKRFSRISRWDIAEWVYLGFR